jgi:hypothetical protein
MSALLLRIGALICFCSAVQIAHAQTAAFDQSPWDALLKAHVSMLRNGQATQVDYAGLAQDRSRLKQYLASVSAVTPAQFERWESSSQLAFLPNAYNAFTIELVLTAYPDLASIKDLGSLLRSPWKKKFIPLLGETRSLDDIEQGLIRGSARYNEPRVHFALNCASIGCPALRPEAFVAERMEAQLESATSAFLSDRTRNRLEAKTLKVSSIFKWYRADFEKSWRGGNSLADFFIRYRQPLELDDALVSLLKAGEIKIDFLDYDWRLNSTTRSAP